MNDVEDFGQYEVKGVKSFVGNEGYGFNCSLYRNGKKIGFCIDDAGGGGMESVQWDRKIDWKEEQKLLDKHVKGLPKVQSSFGDGTMELTIDEGWFVTELVTKWEKEKELKKFRRQCTTKTLFSTKEQNKGEYYVLKQAYGERIKTHLETKYGKDVEIFNEVFEQGKIPSALV